MMGGPKSLATVRRGLIGLVPSAVKRRLAVRLDSDRDRIDKILDHVDPTDTVLDVGCVRHTLEDQTWVEPPRGEFLHADLEREANHVVGLDVVESEVERMNEAGYEVYEGNAETFDLDRTFDVIVAGELIEHLSNPGLFLRRSRKHLHDDGKLILSTPNPRRFHMLIWFITGRYDNTNRQHTCWFDQYVIEELARRAGFELASWSCYRPGHILVTNLLYVHGVHSLGSGGYVFELRPTDDADSYERSGEPGGESVAC